MLKQKSLKEAFKRVQIERATGGPERGYKPFAARDRELEPTGSYTEKPTDGRKQRGK